MTKKLIPMAILGLALTFLLSSCASMFSKSSYPIAIYSTPSEANLKIADKNGKVVYDGKTPANIKLKSSNKYFSGNEYEIQVSLPGYDSHTSRITSSVEGWYFANILLGGLVGMLIIDPLTGAMWKLNDTNVNVSLKASSANSASNEEHASLQIIDINDIPESMKEDLVRIN